MALLFRASIKIKLILIITAVSATVLLLACTVFIANDLMEFKSAMIHDMRILAGITAANCQAAVDFNDAESARETLSALDKNPNVIMACVRNSEGGLLAHYSRYGGPVKNDPDFDTQAGVLLKYDSVIVKEPILSAGKTIGMLCIESDLKRLYGRLAGNASLGALIMGLAMLLAFFLSSKFQKLISNPLLDLLDTTISVTKGEKDYSHRAKKYGDDELGCLADGFNAMMAEIEKRELELEKRGIRLEREVEKRTSELVSANMDLQKAKDAAEAATRAKSRFLANMSHELRTPMNAILGYSQILGRGPGLGPEERAHVKVITRSGEHLLALINDVLEFSKIEAGRVEIQAVSFNLRQMLSELESMFSLRAKRKNLTVEFSLNPGVPVHIRADRGKLHQILINLIGNALKYTENGKVALEVAGDESLSLGRHIQFTVSDTGPGISSDDLENIFDAFVRADEQHNKGTGLGLPISRKYVRMMGGEISVESEVGRGSTFSFVIPVEPVRKPGIMEPEMPRRATGLESGQQDQRILIVEDEDDNRRLLVHLLESADFQVREALNGQEAVELWNTWRPGLVWMDMRMPVMDGYESTKAIRRLELQNPDAENNFQTKIIALTAHAFEEDRAKALEAGCDDFIRKPFLEGEIFDMMRKHLDVRLVYDECATEVEPDRNTPEPEALTELPGELLNDLLQGAEDVDIDLLLSTIERIRGHNPSIACSLESLVENFEYDEILALIKQTSP